MLAFEVNQVMWMDFKAAIKSTRALLVISFCILVLLKVILSLRFHSPWILWDEVVYSAVAADIFGSTYPALPRAYPLLISVAYLFSENKIIIYHIILFINSILSSLIVFPSYFILNKYCPKDFSFMGAITIATLPSLTLYTFVIMTENLFVPLFISSIWFLLEAYETEKPFWIILAVSSVSLLFFTRHSGILMLVGMAVSLIYYLLFGMRSGNIRQRLSSRLIIIISIILSTASLALFALVLTGLERISYFYWLYDRAKIDSQFFLEIFNNMTHLKDYLVLLQNEIAYLMIASYFIFFYIFIMFFLEVFSISVRQSKYASISSWLNSLGGEKRHALRSVGIYYLSTWAILVLTTTMSAYKLDQEIYGRYIDPIVPSLFLFGLIGIYQTHKVSKKPNFRIITSIGIISSIIFFYNFPALKAEEIPIVYANCLESLAPNWLVFPALSAGFLLLLNIYKNLGGNWKIFFAILITFSVGASAYSYYTDLAYNSDRYHAMNQIGIYLNEHSNNESMIIMDNEIPGNDWYFEYITSFWIKKNIIYMPISENLLPGLQSGKNEIYIITSKALPLEPLTYSNRGYYLYKFESQSYE
ncbi:MAG: glycosyltransferase family 39 protein [Methanothrix sp.]